MRLFYKIHYLCGGAGLVGLYVIDNGLDSLFTAVTDRQNSLTAVMAVLFCPHPPIPDPRPIYAGTRVVAEPQPLRLLHAESGDVYGSNRGVLRHR